VAPRLLGPTDVLRVAPPAVVVWSVVRALQVHTREGMPGLQLVETCSSLLLRPGGGRVRLSFLSEHKAFFKASVTPNLQPGEIAAHGISLGRLPPTVNEEVSSALWDSMGGDIAHMLIHESGQTLPVTRSEV